MSLKTRLLPLAVMFAFGAGEAVAANAGHHPAVGRALDLIRNHRGPVPATVNDQYLARDVIVDADGTEHVRFDRTYAGLPVIGGDLVVHSRNGRHKSTSITQGAVLNLPTRPTLQSADAVVVAGAEFGTDFAGCRPARWWCMHAAKAPRASHGRSSCATSTPT